MFQVAFLLVIILRYLIDYKNWRLILLWRVSRHSVQARVVTPRLEPTLHLQLSQNQQY